MKILPYQNLHKTMILYVPNFIMLRKVRSGISWEAGIRKKFQTNKISEILKMMKREEGTKQISQAV